MKTISNVLTKKEQNSFKAEILNYKDAQEYLIKRVSNNKDLAIIFDEGKIANIALDLFGEEFLKDCPLYIEGKKTSLCNALYYIQDKAREALGKPSRFTKQKEKKQKEKEQKEKEQKEKEQKEKEDKNLKSLVQIVQELTYIESNWKNFEKKDKEAIKLALDRLVKLK